MKRTMTTLALAVLLSGCGGGSGPRAPLAPPDALEAARAAAMDAAALAVKAADEAEAAVTAQASNRAADPDSYTLAQEAARRAWEAADEAAAANAAAQAATTLETAQRQRDIAQAKRLEARTERANAAKYAGMVRTAYEEAQADPREMEAARAAAMDAAALAVKAADEAEAAVTAQESNRAADPDSYAFAQEAARRAREAADEAAAANAAAQAATTLEAAERQRDIAQAKRSEARTQRANAMKFAHLVRSAYEASPMSRDASARAAAAAATAAEGSWRAAMSALAEARTYRYADLEGYARAREVVYEVEKAFETARDAAARAQAAATSEEAREQSALAEHARGRADHALARARALVEALGRASRDPAYVSPAVPSAPVFEYGGRVHIGARPGPAAGGFGTAGARGGASLSAGSVRDGAGAADVLDYLRWTTTGVDVAGLPSHPDPPLVRVVEGAGRRFTGLATRAVEIVNAALPYGKRLALEARPVSAPGNTDFNPLPDGSIVIEFAPEAEWPYRFAPGTYPLGFALPRRLFRAGDTRYENTRAQSSHIMINTSIFDGTSPDAVVLHVVLHELLHSLGFDVHTDPERFPRSTLNAFAPSNPPAHILGLVDRDALLAAYDRFEPGALPEDMTPEGLGSWEDTSFHVRGDLGIAGADAGVSFGVSLRNGLAQPWASGPAPAAVLADNPALAGTATWTGALLGISRPLGETVAGDARLAVDLATLDGDLDFTGLERWGVREAPGASGSGATWGDGDLEYTVRVSDNGFVRTGGDAGEVRGAFFGPGHEGMAGVLERADLAAGFGGKR